MSVKRDMDKIKQMVEEYITDAVKLSMTSAVSTANAIVYANAKYGTGNFRNTIKQGFVILEEQEVIGEVIFSPINVRSKVKTSYALPLDVGHKLVYFGKPTGRFVKGKHYSEPAMLSAKQTLEEWLKKL